ncbi:MAG: tRNA (adenosine(37)-N6)-threonylcarbamoyltransferase complex ATPase subunit type 1 TsaE [Candidatus Moranbacteria bacterium]|nr:tRNA (adenosine(37)-N6)-threonylcarbamoyltransferase complex ATPase subunit type 1 TsaE [Candidatus Moranbacteria bacterium]
MSSKDIFITNSSKQTQKMGEILAKELKGGEIICLTGELGSGKTTFAQGVLKGLGARKPYTSPTFVVMKHYKIFNKVRPFPSSSEAVRIPQGQTLKNVYHIDAYRVGSKDILDLGLEEIITGKNNIVIVEWAERIKSIIPKNAIWLGFEHLKDDERKISIK